MFPTFCQYNFPHPWFNGAELAKFGILYYLSGIIGGIIFSTLIIKRYGNIKTWTIIISILSFGTTLAVHLI